MNCDCTEKISLLIDGELPAADARVVERHLLECVECQQARIDFLNLRSQVAAYPIVLSTAEQREALGHILSKQDATTARSLPDDRRTGIGGGRRSNWGPNWRFTPGWAAVAGLLLVGSLLALVFYGYSRSNSTGSPREQTTRVKLPVPDSPPPAADKPKSPNRTESPAVADSRQQKRTTDQPRKNSVPVKRLGPVRTAVYSVAQRNDVSAVDLGLQGDTRTSDLGPVRSADAETMTGVHFENSELLLRAFRNVRLSNDGVAADIDYERQRAQQLVYQNIVLRREADTAGDVQVATLLESLEPILLDIANLPKRPKDEDVRAIQKRVERKNIVALLQVNSTALAGALD
jgi:Putative zinc-finger